MRVAMIGTGYVGLVSGVCFADFGHDVVCVDINVEKVEKLRRGESPIYEPGLDELMAKNIAAGRLSFTTDLTEAASNADAVFIAVGTPTRASDGHADLKYVFAAAEQIANAIRGYTVIVTKSTVPVGTNRRVQEIVRAANPGADFDIASNPEFLREGAAIDDFMRPDRVVLGVESERAQQVMAALYAEQPDKDAPVMFTNLETAEMIKYAANAFLATKISFINEVADICEGVGADVADVAKGIGLDSRIGPRFLMAGPGYGGSCFPKDTLALVRTAEEAGAPIRIVETVVQVNDARKRSMANKVIEACDGSLKGKKIGVLGVTFKADTDDMRDSPSLVILPRLLDFGCEIVAYDPEGRREAEPMMPGVKWAESSYEAAAEADVLVILTEWGEFKTLDFARLRETMKSPVLVDLRNLYTPEEVQAAGFKYSSIGRR